MPIRILLLSHKFYPDIGGIETISEFLANAFSKAGHYVHLITWSEDPSNKIFPFDVIRKPSLQKLFEEHSWAEIVFENNPVLRLSWPVVIYNKPLIIGLHTWIARIDGMVAWQDKFKFKWLNRAKGVIACSDAIRIRCWPKAIVIGNPYQENLFRILPEVPKTLDFVFLGRLVSDKGVSLAIQAFKELFAKADDSEKKPLEFTFTIIGDGPEREELQKTVSAFGLQSQIRFTGMLRGEALVECLNRHRFLLVPSIWEEPFGLVALEGMACGCVPIVSNGGGSPDAVGKAGLVFKSGNLIDLVRCIQNILKDPTQEQMLREAAPIHLREHHPDKVARKYLEILEAAIVKEI